MAQEFKDTVRGKLRVLRRSADDKLRIKYGIMDEEGDLRKEGRYMIMEAFSQPATANDSDAVKSVKDFVQGYVLTGLRELDAAENSKTSTSNPS